MPPWVLIQEGQNPPGSAGAQTPREQQAKVFGDVWKMVGNNNSEWIAN